MELYSDAGRVILWIHEVGAYADLPRCGRHSRFARHTRSGFSKSTERYVPNCLTRTSTGSVIL